eukprot:TRINITY_DN24574_c0_g1_i1.p1 TRINITY_DN24574_c0_g1~~TRINITY_DN24574_c0_g1_i1.p1  ORF type:complete len:848 (+),score=265.49 TRINITY_DN24574_c0_g1_i1:138-2681(+)
MAHAYDVRKKAAEDGSVLALGDGEVGVLLRARYGRKGEWYDLTDYVSVKVARGGLRVAVTPEMVSEATRGAEAAPATTYVRTLHVTYATLASLRVSVEASCEEVEGLYSIAGVYQGMPLFMSPDCCTLYFEAASKTWRLANRRNEVIFESVDHPNDAAGAAPSAPGGSSRSLQRLPLRSSTSAASVASEAAPPLPTVPLPSIATGWKLVSKGRAYRGHTLLAVRPDADVAAVRAWYAASLGSMKENGAQQQGTMNRLAQPKATVEKFKNESKTRRLMNMNQLSQRPKFTMTTLFPTSKSFNEGGHPEQKIKKPSPGDDWSQMVRDGGADRDILWLYVSVDVMTKAKEGQLSLQNVQEIVGKAQRAISKLLGAHGVKQYTSKASAEASGYYNTTDVTALSTPPQGVMIAGAGQPVGSVVRPSSPKAPGSPKGANQGSGFSVRIAQQTLTSEATMRPQSPTSRQHVKDMIKAPQRFGILCDIITTRRCVYTGSPHLIASSIYEFIEQKYPISVRFAFVGITDNASKRVARDMFYKGALPVEQGGSGKNVILHNPLRANTPPLALVDNEHQYAVNPYADYEREYYRGLGEERRMQREKIRKDRYETPKYVAPLPPSWLAKAEARLEKLKAREEAKEAERSGQYIEHCPRCWMRSPSPGSRGRSQETPMCRTEARPQSPPRTPSPQSPPGTAVTRLGDDVVSQGATSAGGLMSEESGMYSQRGRSPGAHPKFLEASAFSGVGDASWLSPSIGASRQASVASSAGSRCPSARGSPKQELSMFLRSARRRSRLAQIREFEAEEQTAKEAVGWRRAAFDRVIALATKSHHPTVQSIPAVQPDPSAPQAGKNEDD